MPGRMIAALAFCLDNQASASTRNLRAQAGPGDPAPDNDDVKIGHFRRWLRIGKPRRLGVTVMFNGGFTDLLLVALAAILIVAAVIDVRTFTISNRLNAAIAADGAPLYWLSLAIEPVTGVADPGFPRGGLATLTALLRRRQQRCQTRRGDCLCGSRRSHGEISNVDGVVAGGVLTLGILACRGRQRSRDSAPKFRALRSLRGLFWSRDQFLPNSFLNQFV